LTELLKNKKVDFLGHSVVMKYILRLRVQLGGWKESSVKYMSRGNWTLLSLKHCWYLLLLPAIVLPLLCYALPVLMTKSMTRSNIVICYCNWQRAACTARERWRREHKTEDEVEWSKVDALLGETMHKSSRPMYESRLIAKTRNMGPVFKQQRLFVLNAW